jgi:NADH-quinone oxidoreductase subunit A
MYITNYLYYQYTPILFFLLICILLSLVIFGASYISASQLKDAEKMSAYECGFEPFNYKNVQNMLSIRFFLVGILFIIFDIELVSLGNEFRCFNIFRRFNYDSFFIFIRNRVIL